VKIRALAGLFAATLLAGGLSTGAAQAAHAAPAATGNAAPTSGVTTNALPNPGTFYEIFTWFANPTGPKCVDVPSRSTARFTRLQVFHCQSTDNQLWAFADLGDGSFHIVNQHSAQCLDVVGSPGLLGAPIEQDNCFESQAQQWRLQVIFNTSATPVFGLVNGLFPNKCLTRSGGTFAVDHDKLMVRACDLGTVTDPSLSAQTWGLG
jgi:hypothetical protein